MTTTVLCLGGIELKGATMNEWKDWFIVNDGVMGGVSQSSAKLTADQTMLFTGNVSLENNGGFASVRHVADMISFTDSKGVALRVKGDGNKYQLRFRTSNRFDGVAYMVSFETKRDEWLDLVFPWDRFSPTFRGRTVKAPPLAPEKIGQVGFLIADKQQGPFRLEVASIHAVMD